MIYIDKKEVDDRLENQCCLFDWDEYDEQVIDKYKSSVNICENMEIKISLSESDLERLKDVLNITSYDDIHTAFIEAMDIMLEKEERFNEENR